MTGLNQNAATVEGARAYLEDVQAGHVSFADESAPFMTLTGYLAALLEIIDGTGEARAYRADARTVLAGLPAPAQPCGGSRPEQDPGLWIERLQGAVLQLLGSTAAALAALDEADRDTLRQAITDAIRMRAAAAAEPCAACVTHPALLCPAHAAELDLVSAYRALAQALALEPEPLSPGR